MPTMGLFRWLPPIEPLNPPSPYAKMPPSVAPTQPATLRSTPAGGSRPPSDSAPALVAVAQPARSAGGRARTHGPPVEGLAPLRHTRAVPELSLGHGLPAELEKLLRPHLAVVEHGPSRPHGGVVVDPGIAGHGGHPPQPDPGLVHPDDRGRHGEIVRRRPCPEE